MLCSKKYSCRCVPTPPVHPVVLDTNAPPRYRSLRTRRCVVQLLAPTGADCQRYAHPASAGGCSYKSAAADSRVGRVEPGGAAVFMACTTSPKVAVAPTIVAAERRALGRNRVLGFISGSTAGARAVRRSGSQPRSRRRGKTVAVRCCAEGSVCAWTWPARGWRQGGAASRS